jgi:uncharacterized SAM-binding protein YcdF (DUF218 family)
MIHMPPWRTILRWVIAWIALELIWLFVAEAWREKEPLLLGLLVALAGPLLGAAWHAFLKPTNWRSALLGVVALAAALIASDVVLDQIHTYAPRFAIPKWELARVASLVVGFALGAWIEKRAWSSWRAISSVLWAISLGVAALVPGVMIYIMVDGSRDSGARADVALVLGSYLAPDGAPLPSMLGRVEHAVELYKTGRVQKLVLSGGVAKNGHTEASVMRDLARAAGVPEEALILELDSRSTIENFACSRTVFANLGVKRALLVTETWHMPRAMLLARRHGLDLVQSPATSDTWKSPRQGWFWLFRDAVALTRERVRDFYASPGVCRARECEGCRVF